MLHWALHAGRTKPKIISHLCVQVMLESGDVKELTQAAKRALEQSIEDMANQGRRLLAFAQKVCRLSPC